MEDSKYVGPGGMAVEEKGTGPRIVFVHGAGGALAWQAQWPMGANWRLVMPARPGYGESPWLGSEDFERDADYIAALIAPSDHLVAHSYGATVAMLAVAKNVGKVASLTIIESGASDVAKDDPDVTAFHYATLGLSSRPPAGDEEFLRTLSDYSAIPTAAAEFAAAAAGLFAPSKEFPISVRGHCAGNNS